MPVFAEDVASTARRASTASWPRSSGRRGGRRATEFYVADPADMPAGQAEVVLWGEDPAAWPLLEITVVHSASIRPSPGCGRWLAGRRHKPHRRSAAGGRAARGDPRGQPARPPGDAAAFAELARRIARGSTAVFLSPEVFGATRRSAGCRWPTRGPLTGMPVVALPEGRMGQAASDLRRAARRRPDGHTSLPRDHPGPRSGRPGPAGRSRGRGDQGVAGLLVGPDGAVYKLGAGRFVLNTLRSARTSAAIRPPSGCCGTCSATPRPTSGKPPAELPADFDQQLKAMGL